MPFILNACSYLLSATLFNNTGRDIRVDWEGEKVVITANYFSEIAYVNGDRKREVLLSSGACEYLYYIPPELSDYKPDNELNRGIQIQLEKDFSIHLLPADMRASRMLPASSF